MSLQVFRVGVEQTPVIIIDNFVQSPKALVEEAARLSPFPVDTATFYPGLRHHITTLNNEGFAYTQGVYRSLSPLIAQTYGMQARELIGASYSLVTTPPEELKALQTRPHVDAYDDGYLAILHYLSETPSGGTGFYRHIATGFETLTEDRAAVYQAAIAREARVFGTPDGYHSGSRDGFTELVTVEARFNRAVIYPGNLLHSGLIPADFAFSSDPKKGRLTANLFVRAA